MMMTILYLIPPIAVLLIILLLLLMNRRSYDARCPHCGERDGQIMQSKREISTRRVQYQPRWLAALGRRRRPVSAHQMFLEGTMQCSRCGRSYERKWFEQVEFF